jgi:hypothetical protein
MAIRDGTKFTVEYGIQTPTSKTMLGVTEALEEAQRTLDMVGDGRLIQRTVSYSPMGRGGRAGANFRLSPCRFRYAVTPPAPIVEIGEPAYNAAWSGPCTE